MTIEVALAFKTVDGLAMADLQVRDDGIGIAHENVKEIFVRGFTTKQKGGRRHWLALVCEPGSGNGWQVICRKSWH